LHAACHVLPRAGAQEDASTAAVLATTLQRHLGGAPRRLREVQGAESPAFLQARAAARVLPARPWGPARGSPRRTPTGGPASSTPRRRLGRARVARPARSRGPARRRPLPRMPGGRPSPGRTQPDALRLIWPGHSRMFGSQAAAPPWAPGSQVILRGTLSRAP